MSREFSRFRSSVLQFGQTLAENVRQGNLLGIAYAAFVLSIFIGHTLSTPVFFFYYIFLPFAVISLLYEPKSNLRFSYLIVLCVTYLIFLSISSFINIDSSFEGFSKQIRYSILIIFFLFTTGFLCTRSAKFIDYLLFALVVGLAVSAAINLYYHFSLTPPESIWTTRLTTRYGMPEYANSTNVSATYAVYFVGAIAALERAGGPFIQRLVLFSAAVILLAALLLTNSRSGYVVAFAGMSVFAMVTSRRNRILLAAVLLAGIAVLFAAPAVWQALIERGLSSRPEVWLKFLGLIADRPFAGYGSFSPVRINIATGEFLDQAHNLVLSAWFRGGVFSALSMAGILVFGNYFAFRLWRITGQIVPLCMMATITVAGSFDYQLIFSRPAWPWVTFWLPFGLCIGAEMILRRERFSAESL